MPIIFPSVCVCVCLFLCLCFFLFWALLRVRVSKLSGSKSSSRQLFFYGAYDSSRARKNRAWFVNSVGGPSGPVSKGPQSTTTNISKTGVSSLF